MSNYIFTKAIVAPDQGVDFSVKSHLLKENQWAGLEGLRCRQGIMSDFPGWRSIFSSKPGYTFTSLLTEFRHRDASRVLVIGNQNKLYKYDVSTHLPVEIGAGPYAPDRFRTWKGVVYNDKLYITNKQDGVQKYDGLVNFAPVANSPKGWSINLLNNHLCVFGDGTNPWTFRWAAEGTDNFVATATNDAGQFDVIDNDDVAQNLLPLDLDLIGYKDRSIHAFTYIGGNAVMGHRRMVSDVGLLAPDGIAAFTDHHIFFGDPPGVYLYTGGNSVDPSIGRPIEDKVFGEIPYSKKHLVKALVNDDEKEIIFFYPNSVSVAAANRMVIFNMRDKVWYGPFNVTGCEVDATVNFSIDFANVIDSFTAPFIIDTVNSVIDSFGVGTSVGGDPLFGTSIGDVMGLGASPTADGAAITRTGWTGENFLGIGSSDGMGAAAGLPLGSVFQVNQVNLEVLNTSPATLNYYIGYKMTLADDMRWKGPYNFQAIPGRRINIPLRAGPGRWFASKFESQNSAIISLAGIQYFFSFLGER